MYLVGDEELTIHLGDTDNLKSVRGDMNSE